MQKELTLMIRIHGLTASPLSRLPTNRIHGKLNFPLVSCNGCTNYLHGCTTVVADEINIPPHW